MSLDMLQFPSAPVFVFVLSMCDTWLNKILWLKLKKEKSEQRSSSSQRLILFSPFLLHHIFVTFFKGVIPQF